MTAGATRGTRTKAGWKMLTREEIDFHRRVTTELSAIRKALERIAGVLAKNCDGTDNSKEKENDHRED